MKNKITKLLILLSLCFLLSNLSNNDIKILTKEAKSALNYLNKIRQNPKVYSKEIGVNLSYVKQIHTLKWDENLAKAAVEKANDMANRNYFSHIDPDGNGMNIKINNAGYKLPKDWLSPKSNNFFESIYYESGYSENESGIRTIKSLVLDKGTNPPGHRNHLLGINKFWANCYDCGIGIVKKNRKIYVSILIAKHDY